MFRSSFSWWKCCTLNTNRKSYPYNYLTFPNNNYKIQQPGIDYVDKTPQTAVPVYLVLEDGLLRLLMKAAGNGIMSAGNFKHNEFKVDCNFYKTS